MQDAKKPEGKRFKLSRKKGQRITIPPSKEPTEILVTSGKAHLSFPSGVVLEWEGKHKGEKA